MFPALIALNVKDPTEENVCIPNPPADEYDPPVEPKRPRLAPNLPCGPKDPLTLEINGI
jgi:hypothetical protein